MSEPGHLLFSALPSYFSWSEQLPLESSGKEGWKILQSSQLSPPAPTS